jgi:hypothetical protein
VRALFLPSRSAMTVRDLKTKVEALGHYADVPDEALDTLREEIRKTDVVLAVGELTQVGVWAWGFSNGLGKKVVCFTGVLPCLGSKSTSEKRWLKSLPVQGALFKGAQDAG